MPSGAPCEALPGRCYSLAADETVLCNGHVANFKSISAVCKPGGQGRDVAVQMDFRASAEPNGSVAAKKRYEPGQMGARRVHGNPSGLTTGNAQKANGQAPLAFCFSRPAPEQV